MPDIKNNNQLVKLFSTIATAIIFQVSEEVLEILRKNIEDYTYGELPNIEYYDGTGKPTYQFLNAFEFTKIKKQLNTVLTELWYDWMSMEYDGETWLHGYPGEDNRQTLADILNVDDYLGFSSHGKPRKPYWDITINELFNGGRLEKLFDDYTEFEFKKRGIKVVKM
jgi:hypothetical protein